MSRSGDDPARGFGRRRFLLGAAGIGGAAALGPLLAACSGDDDRAAPRDDDAEPQPGGRLTVGVADLPATYELGSSGGSWGSSYQAFASPLFNGGTAEGLEVTGALAEGYEASDDGLVHTITLRSGLVFHDGSPLDADAAAQCLGSQVFADHPLRDQGPYAHTRAGFGAPPNVQSIEPVDDLRLVVRVIRPRSDIRTSITQHYLFNPAVMARPGYGTDSGALRDIGSGPFRVTAFQPSTFLELERFGEYVEPALLDALRFENFTDAAAMALALRSGDIDAGYGLSKSDHESLASDAAFAASQYEPSFNVFFTFSPPRTPALADARVREAIMLATDRPSYRRAFFTEGTAAAPTAQPGLHPDRPGFIEDLEERPYDPDRARELIRAAGAQGAPVRLVGYASAPQIPEQASLLQAMASDLEAVGLEPEVTITDIATWVATRYEHDLSFNAFSPESSSFIFALLYSAPARIGTGWPEGDPRSDPDVSRLLQEGLDAFRPEDQDRAFQELAQLEHDELLMSCPVAQVKSSLVARREVRALRITTLGPAYERTWVAAR